MPAHDLSLLIDCARQAGQVALSYTGATALRWDKPQGAGPVTEADLAVNAMLHERLMQARPDYGWLSEESDDNAVRLGQSHVFIIDPIDGTRSFIEGADTWSHSLAVARDGEIIAAVVYLPMLDRLYAASLGGGSKLNEVPIKASATPDLVNATVLATKPVMAGVHWAGGPRLQTGAPPVFGVSVGPCGSRPVRWYGHLAQKLGMGHRGRCLDRDRGRRVMHRQNRGRVTFQ